MNIRKIIAVAASSALMFAAPIAFASDATTIVNSGDHATVFTSSNQNSSVNVNNTNTAVVNQMVNASASTGSNTANHNISTGTTGTSIVTGDAGLTANFNVNANRNTTLIGQTNPTSANLTDVTNTGDGANVNTSNNTTSAIQVNNTNRADVTQSCGGMSLGLNLLSTDRLLGGGCSANTGDNHANGNIGGAAISTGQAGIGTNFQTTVNRNQTVIGDPLGMESSGSVLDGTSITNTGDNATVFTSSNNNSTVGVNNSNDAMISQMLDAFTNSGDNHANGNIGGSAVLTGDAGITSNMNVNANTNATGIGNGFGMTPLMSNLNDFVNTGDNMMANTSTNANSATTLNNTSALMSSQFVFTHSSSGDNHTNSNVGTSLIGTTGAGVNGSMSIGGNTNTTVLGGLLNSLLNLLLM